jgi:hypothetical protein
MALLGALILFHAVQEYQPDLEPAAYYMNPVGIRRLVCS